MLGQCPVAALKAWPQAGDVCSQGYARMRGPSKVNPAPTNHNTIGLALRLPGEVTFQRLP
jgi:hypothetical protein